jgi:hypothetical protein
MGNDLPETVFDNIMRITNANNIPEIKMIAFAVLRVHLKEAFNTKYHEGTKDKEN